MKQKLKQPLLLLLAIILLFSVVNCTKDSFEDIQNLDLNEEILTSKSPFLVDYLSADQAPVFVKEMFPSRNTAANVTSTNSYIDTETGAVFDEQTIMKVTDTLGNTNYTIRFGFPHTPGRIFYNLIVGRDAQGVMNEPYIVRYVSDSTAFAAFKDSNYNFSKFMGKITYHRYADFFGTDKSLIGDLVVANRANRRGQAIIDAQTSCPTEFDEFGDPIACETLTLDGGTSGSTGGGSGSGEGLPSGGTAGDDAGVDPSPPPGDGSTSDGSDGTREPEDPIDPVGGDPCCDVGGGGTLDGGKVVVTESYVITTNTWPSGSGSCSQTTVTSSKTYSDGTTEYSSRTSGLDCVNLDGTNEIITAVNTFEECPECITPTDGSIGILPPRDSTTEVPSEEEQIINNLTNPCAKEIFTELENGLLKDDPLKPEVLIPKENIELNFSESILKLFNDSKTFNYVISNGNLLDANASTIGAKTTVSNSYLANATQLSIARTMIHEMVHAYLNNVYFNRPDFENKSLLEKMRSYATDNGYTDYMRFHHEFMGQYVNAMAFSLFEWDKEFGSGGNLGWSYYQAMAFGGLYYKIKDEEGNEILIETDSFKELVPNQSDRDKIRNILINEQDGNSNAQGEKCD